MFNKLFSITEVNLHYLVKIFGIKLRFRSLKLAYKKIKELEKKQLSPSCAEFLWAAEEKYNTKDKIWFLSQEFYNVVGYYPNFKIPNSFNEKLNWLKLNYYNPTHNTCIDKYKVKEYIKNQIGKEYVIPLLAVYDDVNDIDFDILPNQFVIKTNISGGALAVQVIKNKAKINVDKIKATFNNNLQDWNSLYYNYLSRGYKDIEPKIIIEEYMESDKGQLYDYKVYCFHGEPKWVLACTNRNKRTLYENHYLDWSLMVPSGKSSKKSTIPKPKCLDEMLYVARKLSSQFPFLRVDLYEVDNKVYVGEMSFTPASGFNAYYKEWDYKIGEWLDLAKIPAEHLYILPEFAEGAKTFLPLNVVETRTILENTNN